MNCELAAVPVSGIGENKMTALSQIQIIYDYLQIKFFLTVSASMKRLSVVFGLLLCLLVAADEVIPPPPAHYFNDYANVVSATNVSALNEMLVNYERESSDQIVVAVYPKMQSDAPINEYTRRIANSWGVGQKGENNGVALFVFVQNHKMFLTVGTGLEKVLTNDKAKQIIDTCLVPHFKKGDYDGGFSAAVPAIIAATKGAFQGNRFTEKKAGDSSTNAASNTGASKNP